LVSYYLRPGASTSSTWVFSLEGGGECVTQQDCTSRAKTPLGSSTSWPPTTELGQVRRAFRNCIPVHFSQLQYQSTDPLWNPRLYNAHHVFVKYCTGDLFIGGVSEPSNSTYGLYFSGRRVVEAVIEELLTQGLSSANLVVWSGDSAGGIGTRQHPSFTVFL
jgi:hypothetical protein